MDEVQDAIAAAWERVKVRIADKPAELRKRLARIQQVSLNKTPRARCLAVRANDRRIERTVVGSGERPERHEVWLYGDEVRALCAPVEITPPGEDVQDVAARLGVTPQGLTWARLKGEFQAHHCAGLDGRRGRPVPLIYTARQLHPNAPRFAEPDEIWGWLARDLHTRIADDFVQTVVRVPCFWMAGRRYDDDDVPDLDEGREAPPRTGRRSLKLPPPAPDYVPYKWKGDEYVGYDWREAARNPLIRENHERRERKLARNRAWRAARAKRNPPASRAGGSICFRGWRWICPACARPVKVLFYPLPPVSVLQCALAHYSPELPRWFVDEALAALDAERAAPARFACAICSRVEGFSRVSPAMWNSVISCLSRGLLYGHEVERPACVTMERKRPFRRRKVLPRPEHVRRRRQVCERLIKGWSDKQIAAELGISLEAEHGASKVLYKQHRVSGRRELARKLGAPIEPLMSKRAQVRAGLAAGQSAAQIARELGIGRKMVSVYAWQFRREACERGASGRAGLKGASVSRPRATV